MWHKKNTFSNAIARIFFFILVKIHLAHTSPPSCASSARIGGGEQYDASTVPEREHVILLPVWVVIPQGGFFSGRGYSPGSIRDISKISANNIFIVQVLTSGGVLPGRRKQMVQYPNRPPHYAGTMRSSSMTFLIQFSKSLPEQSIVISAYFSYAGTLWLYIS